MKLLGSESAGNENPAERWGRDWRKGRRSRLGKQVGNRVSRALQRPEVGDQPQRQRHSGTKWALATPGLAETQQQPD